jgi:uncharacterized protein with PQ loop repeat
MTIFSLLSIIAVTLGFFSAIPQIVAMVRHKNAAGQSTGGWVMGLTMNGMMSYVNLIGFHIATLGIGNLVSAFLCAIATICTVRLPNHAQPAHSILEMPTQEFEVLRDMIVQRDERSARS